MAFVLEGLKVADFTWVGVGPITMKSLADHGATVVHVESRNRVEVLRNAPPFKDREPGIDRGSFFANFNSSKYGVGLDLRNPKAIEVAKRLIGWADVVAESFTPGTMSRLGLDYESVKAWKQEIIYFSSCQLGQTGPWASQPGYGTQLAALAGFYHLGSWPDKEPAGPYGAYTDFISPRFGVTAVLAALEHRRRTGDGVHIDLSQLEAGIQFLGPYVMEALNNHHEPELIGNRDELASPHGAFPCEGDLDANGFPDRWIVIAVFNDTQWGRLCDVMGNPLWARSSKFADLHSRKVNEDELERFLAEWTNQHEGEGLMQRLQSAGVPSGLVQNCEDLYKDQQLLHWGGFVELEHAVIGKHNYDGLAFHLSKTPGELRMPAPALGQHNGHVYKDILGMDPEEFDAFESEGVFT